MIMKRKSTVLIAVLSAVTIVFATQSHKKKDETPNERFYRKGGKETKADITVRSGELTTLNIAQQRDLVLYDDGGHINCRLGMVQYRGETDADFNSERCRLPKLRDFVTLTRSKNGPMQLWDIVIEPLT